MGRGQTTQPWVSPDTVPPFRRRHQPGTAACPHWGRSRAARPTCGWRLHPEPRSGLVGQHSAIPSLVRKSFKLAVEEWKVVGNQTGSFLEGSFFLCYGFSHHHHHHGCFFFCYGLVLFFPPSFSANHSFQHIPRLFFLLCLSPHSPWALLVGVAGQEMGEGAPKDLALEEGSSVSL